MTGPDVLLAHIASLPEASAPTAEEIRAAREGAGLTQTQAGQLLYSSLRGWQSYEGGERTMSPAMFEYFQLLVTKPKVRAERRALHKRRSK